MISLPATVSTMIRCLPISQGAWPHPEWEGSQTPKYPLDYPHKCLSLCVQSQLHSNGEEESSELSMQPEPCCASTLQDPTPVCCPFLCCLQRNPSQPRLYRKNLPASLGIILFLEKTEKKRWHNAALGLQRTRGAHCSQCLSRH